MYEIELQYFKRNGKYYTEGKYKTDKEQMHEIHDEINDMKKKNNLPGVSGGDYIIYVNADKHPNGYPMLII